MSNLREIVAEQENWVEIRYHKREKVNIEIKNGMVTKANTKTLAGAGIRCLVDGCWGFIATSDTSRSGLEKAVDEAIKAAEIGSEIKEDKIDKLVVGELARGEFNYVDTENESEPSLEEKLNLFLEIESEMRDNEIIAAGLMNYSQFNDDKIIVNSDGASAKIHDVKRDLGLTAIGISEGKQEMGSASAGTTGSWQDLFAEKSLADLKDKAVKIAQQKLKADYAPGGKYTVILDPMLVGILSHEAIGHTVEADFVSSGSIVKGKIGEKVASDLITMVDDGTAQKTSGMTMVDDEGVLAQRTVIIKDGILKNYLHNRESAESFSTKPLGNARAFTYRDEPLIRMTNTFILPGESEVTEMIAGIEDGFYLKGLGQGGQADANAEFMFGVQEAYRIKDGEIKEPVKGITISGQAFEVLQSVDAVGNDFQFALGRGYCGKGQPAKVDAGGPHIRCQVTIGGQQE